jgi:DNA-binding NarL/FixJ family response regulator
VIGEATNGVEVQFMLQELSPDVLLLDLSMPGPSAATTALFVQKECPQVKILILTAYKDESYVRDLINLGVSGYVLKDEVPETLVRAIHGVAEGDTWLSHTILEIITKPPTDLKSQDHTLTDREEDVFRLIAKGFTNGQIGKTLGITEGTVKNHVVSLYTKLNIHSRSEAVVRAIEYTQAKPAEGIEEHNER